MSEWQPIETAPLTDPGNRIIVSKIGYSNRFDPRNKEANEFGTVRDKDKSVFFVSLAYKKKGGKWTDGVDTLVDPTHWQYCYEIPASN